MRPGCERNLGRGGMMSTLERGLCVNVWNTQGFPSLHRLLYRLDAVVIPLTYPNGSYYFYTADAQLLFDGQILSERRL